MTRQKNTSSAARFFTLAFGLCALLASAPVHAEKSIVDVISAATTEPSKETSEPLVETDPPLLLTPDRSEIVRLKSDAASVVVGNPDHISVLAESPTLLVVVPKATGASYFTILDNDGDIIMQRHVIVGSPKDDYVRVKKTCQKSSDKGNSSACKPTNIYYCPDMCHNVGAQGEEATDAADQAPEDKASKDEEPAEKAIYEDPDRGTEE